MPADRRCRRPGTAAPPVDAPTTIDAAALCASGERACASPMQPRHCEGGAWVDDPICAAAAPICDRGACQAACSPTARRCLDERTPEVCNASGYWDAQETCAFACTGEGACTGSCVPFAKECRNGNQLWQCGRDGNWAVTTCAIVCEDGACGGACSAGQTRCSPTAPRVPETCSGGHWQDQAPCAYACLPDGSCAPDCEPAGPGTCIDGDAYRCDATGRWTLAQTCATNCSAGSCTGACADSTKQCAGRTPETCTGGVWVDGTPCADLCDQGGCVVTECHPNVDRKCVDGIPSSCDAGGHWVAGAACTWVCDGDQCGGICKPGSKRCNGANLETCAPDGKSWVLDQACPFGCAGGQCSSCTPDPMTSTCQGRCGTVVNNCGAPVDCGDGCAATHGPAWSCGPAQTCVCTRDVGADCSGRCGSITDRCGFAVDCSATGNGGVACNAAGQVCKADHSCCTQEPLATTCSGDPGDDCSATVPNNCGVPVTCSSACDAGFSCGGDPATPSKCSCSPSSVRCAGNVAQTCAGGLSWTDDMTCAVACIDGLGCGSCTPTQTQCADATHVETCQASGSFGAPVACPASAPACRPSTKSCGGVCVPGTMQCGTSAGAPAVLRCDAEGQWSIVVQTCPFTCESGACAGECHVGDTQCDADTFTLRTCGTNDRWSTTNCPNHCGVAGGIASCCIQSDAEMCPETGGAPCNRAVPRSCGYPATCGPDCQPYLTCGGNGIAPEVCSCTPSSAACVGSTLVVCNATGTAVTTTECGTNGCDQTACCQSDSQFCAATGFCDSVSYCNRIVDCGQFVTCPAGYQCNVFIADKCAQCNPDTYEPVCNRTTCDSDGTIKPGPGCVHNTCCCDLDGFCESPAACGGGSCR